MTTTEPTQTAAQDDETMGGVDHTHPHRNTTFGSVFRRGQTIAADGGEPASDATTSGDSEPGDATATDGGAPGDGHETTAAADVMGDVSHTPPHGEGANDVFERGEEGRVGADDE